KPLVDALGSVGVAIRKVSDLLIEMDSSEVKSGDIRVNQEMSSQFVSSLMLMNATGKFHGKIILEGKRTSRGYIDITEKCINDFGLIAEKSENYININGKIVNEEREMEVERDYSSAAYFIVLGLLASTKGIRIVGLRKNSFQPDAAILDILKPYLEVHDSEDGTIEIISRVTEIGAIEMDADQNPDLAPPISVIGIFSESGVIIRDVRRISFKESDRVSGIIKMAQSFGALIETDGSTLKIRKGNTVKNPDLFDFHDHRIIMSAAIAAITSGSNAILMNSKNVGKSYPTFFQDLKSVGVEVEKLAEL
ncbi:MAG: 3-phosphoshikimate 1-carboxyvinyltransferase, partial [Thermoplasmataceae archaeon]